MALADSGWNFLGVEIREPLVTEANEIAAEEGLQNLHYEFCNAMIWLGKLARTYTGRCSAGSDDPVSRSLVQKKARQAADG